jgi:hypothetical protein
LNPIKLDSRGEFFLTTKSVITAVEEGFDYILSHFESQRLWPRTVSTKATENRQVIVNSKEEALVRFKESNYFDCRISAYPPPSKVSSFVGVNLNIAPSIIMIDLDRETFNTQKAFEMALSKTLNRIVQISNSAQSSAAPTLKKQNGFQPTVIWSGNGYHIYLVLDAFVLESVDVFNNDRFGSTPSQKFLRFAESFLSSGKCDPQHNRTVSLRNSMLRVPGTINSKNGQMVKIVQKWNGYRPSIKLFLEDFYIYLCCQRLAEMKKRRYKLHRQHVKSMHLDRGSTIQWIENLLQISLTDYRKLVVWRILAPYLLKNRKLSYNESYSIIRGWLERCNKVRRLDFSPDRRIKSALNGSWSFFPVSCDKLRDEHQEFYKLLQNNGVLTR